MIPVDVVFLLAPCDPRTGHLQIQGRRKTRCETVLVTSSTELHDLLYFISHNNNDSKQSYTYTILVQYVKGAKALKL